MPVMFSAGNENHLISHFLPAEGVAALDQLVSYEVHLAAGMLFIVCIKTINSYFVALPYWLISV